MQRLSTSKEINHSVRILNPYQMPSLTDISASSLDYLYRVSGRHVSLAEAGDALRNGETIELSHRAADGKETIVRIYSPSKTGQVFELPLRDIKSLES